MTNLRIFIILTILCTLSSCTEDINQEDSFDRGPILLNLADNIIIPSYKALETKNIALTQATEKFIETRDEETLAALKLAWQEARLTWKSAEAFNFGPIESLALETSMDLWPTNESGLEESIMLYNNSDDYLLSIGSDKKGYAAIEYMLFASSPENTISAFDDENRREYLNLLALDLNSISWKVLQEWKDNYRDLFVVSLGNGVGSSLTQLTNEFIATIETIKNFKVATPLGLRSIDGPLPNKVESYYAKISIALIISNLNTINDIFEGKGGASLDDYLDGLQIRNDGVLLSQDILTQIQKCKSAASEIDMLSDAVINDAEKVEQLFIELQQLTVITKTDMMSRLGLVVTFSDNDGD